ncbi:MAG: TolC family protein [Azonexus sp.]|jgi:outer membrane protein TolC|uniref:TolC family protein n=1 Tax=Azonexus sp. TaxID=1872668 RepID=UPI00282D95E2|nr:TolC family protein [Azonexus sp.]MDR0776771.1 TolC family protein [Azonexus sp.]
MKPKRSFIALAAATLLAGCSVIPELLTQEAVRERVEDDQFRIYSDQEQVFAPIGFDEAVARALKYNLDYRLKVMESAVNLSLAEVSRYDMLPSVLASAGYAMRNNDAGSTSYDVVTGQDLWGGNPTSSQERRRRIAGVEFSWTALDFGVSYYRARQQADQFLISEERRKRVMQTIVADVRSAYWRAAGAQRLMPQTEALMVRARTALERSREAERMGLLPPREALNYQRQLLDAIGLLAARRQELEYAKRELAALMNITPGTDFMLHEDDEPALMGVPFNVAELEELALHNRPELREEDYRRRITAAEARKQMLSVLPNLSLNFGPQYDSNRYLYNNSWIDSTVRASFNLMRLAALPSINKSREAQEQLDDARRMALSMAVLTQVRVAVELYRMSLYELDVARESSAVDQRLLNFSKAALATRAESDLDLIRAEVRALNSDHQRHLSYAHAQAAFGRIYNSIGLEVLPDDIAHLSVASLATLVSSHLQQVESDTFPTLLVPEAQALPSIRLDIATPGGNGMPETGMSLHAAVRRVLEHNQFKLNDGPDAGTTLQLALDLVPTTGGGIRPIRALWTLRQADGALVGSQEYRSVLPADVSARALTAFAEAATVAHLATFQGWLQRSHESMSKHQEKEME